MFDTVQRMVDAPVPKKVVNMNTKILAVLREDSRTLQIVTVGDFSADASSEIRTGSIHLLVKLPYVTLFQFSLI